MTNKRKILIQLSDEDAEFFSELLARDDVEIVSDVRWNEIETTKATYTLTTIDNHIHIKQLNDELIEHHYSIQDAVGRIKGYSELLLSNYRESLTGDQNQHFLNTIRSQAEQVQDEITLIRGKLNLSIGRIVESITINNTPFDVEKAINSVIPYIHKLTNREVKVKVTIDNNLALGYADEERFQSVIYHLFRILFIHSSIASTYEIIATLFSSSILIKLISSKINTDIETIRLAVDAQGFERDFGFDGMLRKWGGHIVSVNPKSVDGIQLHFTIPIAKEDAKED